MKAIFKVIGQKAFTDEFDMGTVILQDFARFAKKYPAIFGNPEETSTYANMIATNSLDSSASTVKLKCKDSAKIALDISLPWSQAQAEFAKISGTPEIDIILAGIVG